MQCMREASISGQRNHAGQTSRSLLICGRISFKHMNPDNVRVNLPSLGHRIVCCHLSCLLQWCIFVHFRLEELAAPYFVFEEAGFDVTVASVKGGKIPVGMLRCFFSNSRDFHCLHCKAT